MLLVSQRSVMSGVKLFLDIVGALFGSYDAKAGRRAIQELLLSSPQKNGKIHKCRSLNGDCGFDQYQTERRIYFYCADDRSCR